MARRPEGRAFGSDTRGHFLALLLTLGLVDESFRLTSPPWTPATSMELSSACDGNLDERRFLLWLLLAVEGIERESFGDSKFKVGKILLKPSIL